MRDFASEAIKRYMDQFGLRGRAWQERLEAVGLTEQDFAILRSLASLVERNSERMAAELYDHLWKFQDFRALVAGSNNTRERLQESQRRAICSLFQPPYGEDFISHRLTIGILYAWGGIPARWYLTSQTHSAFLLQRLLFRRYVFQPWKILPAWRAVTRALGLEKELVLEAYAESIADDRFQSLAGQVQKTANEVMQTAGNLESITQQVSGAMQQMAAAVQEVARGTADQTSAVGRTSAAINGLVARVDGVAAGAESQAHGVAEATEAMTQVRSGVDEVAAGAEQVAGAAADAYQAALQGATAVNEATEGMARIRKAVEATAARVRELGARSEQIGSIIEVIDDIAEQTNLLALNAAIEAARAGEAGKGFAVVAEEVRKLAERSGQATKEIADLIRQVQQETDAAVTAMEAGVADVEAGAGLAQAAAESLQAILDAVERTNHQVAEIARTAQAMAAGAAAAAERITSIAAVAEENARAAQAMTGDTTEAASAIEAIASSAEAQSAAAQEVAAQSQEVSAQAEELTGVAAELSRLAQGLLEAVQQVRTQNAVRRDWTEQAQNQAVQERPRRAA